MRTFVRVVERRSHSRKSLRPSNLALPYTLNTNTQEEYILSSSSFTPSENDCSFVSRLHIPYSSFPATKSKYKSYIVVTNTHFTPIVQQYSDYFLIDRSELPMSSADIFGDLFSF